MLPFPSHGASGGAASGSISDFSNRTFVESDGSDPSLWDLSSFRKRRCSATSNAFTCSESSLISSCNRANPARRTLVRAVTDQTNGYHGRAQDQKHEERIVQQPIVHRGSPFIIYAGIRV